MLLLVLGAWLGPKACHLARYGPGPHSLNSSMLDVDKGFTFPPGFPPDPGAPGKEGIEGIDSDNDGVRDDVQRWIYALVPKEPKKQMALRQKARYYQFAMQLDFGPDVRREAKETMDRAIYREHEAFQDQLLGYYEDKHLMARMLDTRERTARYLDNDRKWTTEEMSGEWPRFEGPCENR